MDRDKRLNRIVSLSGPLPLCAIVGTVIGGFIVRIGLPNIPLADGDTWGYLHPALSWLNGLGFRQTLGRDWLYPALVAGILKIGGDFRAISYAQRFLGLAGLLIFWLNWRSFKQLLPEQKLVSGWICFGLTLLLFAFYALSPQQALLEDTIQPEGMMAFFEMAYLYCLVSFFSARWRLRLAGRTIAFGAGVLGLSYVLLLLKPSWGFSFGFSIFCVAIGGFGRAARLVRFGPVLAGGTIVLLLFFLPKLLTFQKDADSRLFLPFTLVSIHAPQILETNPNNNSLDINGSGAVPQLFYEELARAFQKAKEKPSHYTSLGFDPDYILYFSGFFSVIQQKEGWDDAELAAVCYSAYFRAWLHAPWSMARKVWKQINLFLFPRAGNFYSTGQSVDLNRELANSRTFLPGDLHSPGLPKNYQSYLERLERPEKIRPHPLGFSVVAKLAFWFARASCWIQLAFFAVMVAVCLSRKERTLRLAGFVIVAVLAATYGNVLTIAVVHSLDVVRYRITYAPGFLLGMAMVTNYLLILALNRRSFGEPDRNSAAVEANIEQT